MKNREKYKNREAENIERYPTGVKYIKGRERNKNGRNK